MTYNARTDLCVCGYNGSASCPADHLNCDPSNPPAGKQGSGLVFRMQDTDPIPWGTQLSSGTIDPTNTAISDPDFNTYSIMASGPDLRGAAGISLTQPFILGSSGEWDAFNANDSLFLERTEGGAYLVVALDPARIQAKTCSTGNPCVTYTGLRTGTIESNCNPNCTKLANGGDFSFSRKPGESNILYERLPSGLAANKLTINVPADPHSSSYTFSRNAYVDFTSDTPVACSVLPADYWNGTSSMWTGGFSVADDGSMGWALGGAGKWHANTSYTATESFIVANTSPNNAGHYAFQASTSGTSDPSTEPLWPQTKGNTMCDPNTGDSNGGLNVSCQAGQVQWQNIGTINGQDHGFDVVNYRPGHGCSRVNAWIGKIYRGTGNNDPAGWIQSDQTVTCTALGQSTPCQLTDANTLHGSVTMIDSQYVSFTLTGGGSAPSAPFVGLQSCRSNSGTEQVCWRQYWRTDSLYVRPCPAYTGAVSAHCDAHKVTGRTIDYGGGSFWAHAMKPGAGASTYGPVDDTGAPYPGGNTPVLPFALAWDQHGSDRAANANDTNPLPFGMDDVPTQYGRRSGTGYTSPWYQELMLAKPDGSLQYRFAHNWCTGSVQSFEEQNCIGVISQTGLYHATATDVMGTRGSISPAWAINHNYNIGDFINPTGVSNSKHSTYRALQMFSSGLTEPDWSGCQMGGSTCTTSDGICSGSCWVNASGTNGAGQLACNYLRADLPGGSGNIVHNGDRIYPVQGNAGSYIYQVTSACSPSCTTGTATWCQTYGCTVTDSNSVQYQNIGANDCNGDIIIESLNSASH